MRNRSTARLFSDRPRIWPAIHRGNHQDPFLPHMAKMQSQEDLLASLVNAHSPAWPYLPDKPEESPHSAIRAMWFAAAGMNRSVEKAAQGELPLLSDHQQAQLGGMIEKRLSGTPLAHLIGWQAFMGIELRAGPQALIPRKETEILGAAALTLLRDLVQTRRSARVIDLCTGSGNLAVALATLVPECQVFGADLSAEAVGLARENAAFHHLEDRITFHVGDLFSPFVDGSFDGAVDMVVCNPPYLSTSKVRALPREIGEFEPKAAFDAGAFGLGIISRLISDAPRFLRPGSWLCFEVGLGQGPFFAGRVRQNSAYKMVEAAVDKEGEVRALCACT